MRHEHELLHTAGRRSLYCNHPSALIFGVSLTYHTQSHPLSFSHTPLLNHAWLMAVLCLEQSLCESDPLWAVSKSPKPYKTFTPSASPHFFSISPSLAQSMQTHHFTDHYLYEWKGLHSVRGSLHFQGLLILLLLLLDKFSSISLNSEDLATPIQLHTGYINFHCVYPQLPICSWNLWPSEAKSAITLKERY